MKTRGLIKIILTVGCALFLLGGCGKEKESRDSGRNAGTTSVEKLPSQLEEHKQQLAKLRETVASQKKKDGTVFRFYYDDTRSMLGFVHASEGKGTFANLLDASVDQAIEMVGARENGIERVEAYTLVDEVPGDGSNQELNWKEIDAVGSLQGYFMTESFYTGSHAGHREGTLNHVGKDGTVSKLGPLARLFMDGKSPFGEDGLTVIVSDLQEQGFDLYTICDKLKEYCRKVPSAEVCLMSCTSRFKGQISAAVYSNSETGFDMVSVDDYDGNATFYYLITGPANLVDAYCEGIRSRLGEAEDIIWSSFKNSGSVYAEPLKFITAPNTMAGVTSAELAGEKEREKGRDRAAASDEIRIADIGQALASGRDAAAGTLLSEHIYEVWGSANVSNLKEYEGYENVFRASYGENTDSCAAFGTNMLISAYADLPEDMAAACGLETESENTYRIHPAEIQLYEKTENGEWVEADKNALGCIDLRFETVKGPLYEFAVGDSILAQGRRVAYLRVLVDAKTVEKGGLMKAQTEYFLSVPIHTARQNTTQSGAEQIKALAADAAEYRKAIEGLWGNGKGYNWAKSSEEAQKAARELFCKTPKLDVLIASLENIFAASPSSKDVQFVDYLLRVSESTNR